MDLKCETDGKYDVLLLAEGHQQYSGIDINKLVKSPGDKLVLYDIKEMIRSATDVHHTRL